MELTVKNKRQYLVSDGINHYAITPDMIDSDNGKGANLRLLKVDEKGRIYLEEEEPSYEELYEND